MGFSVGDKVRVASPFDARLPDVYPVEATDETGAYVVAGFGFDAQFLTLVEAANGAEAAAVGPVRITPYAMRARFTVDERIAIDLASVDDPAADPSMRKLAAALRVYAADMAVAQYVDLTLPETIAGIQALEAAGLISGGRAAEILSTTVSAAEAA